MSAAGLLEARDRGRGVEADAAVARDAEVQVAGEVLRGAGVEVVAGPGDRDREEVGLRGDVAVNLDGVAGCAPSQAPGALSQIDAQGLQWVDDAKDLVA